MPVYNAEKYLSESIESVLNQHFVDFELIIIDDGSTDNSKSIAASYRDKRIRFVENRHHYIESLNKGMSIASGKYIARMDADDVMLPNRLQIQADYMIHHPNIDICGSWMKTFGQNEFIVKTLGDHCEIIRGALQCTPLLHPTVMMKQSIISSFPMIDGIYQVYNEQYIYAEDYKLWIDLIMKGYQFANIPQILLSYRLSEAQVTQLKQKEMAERTYLIQHEYMEYAIEQLTAKKEVYYEVLNNSIELFNNDSLSFDDLRSIVYILFKYGLMKK